MAEDKTKILKQKWIVTDCEKQEELEDNYNNKLCQKLSKYPLYHKNRDVSYCIVFYGQMHSDIVTAAKRSTIPGFETVHKDHDVLGQLSILRLICINNLSGAKVDLYLEQLQIFLQPCPIPKIRAHLIIIFGDTVYNQVLATQPQCGAFIFGDNYHTLVLSDNGKHSLKIIFLLIKQRRIIMIKRHESLLLPSSVLTTAYSWRLGPISGISMLLINQTMLIWRLTWLQ